MKPALTAMISVVLLFTACSEADDGSGAGVRVTPTPVATPVEATPPPYAATHAGVEAYVTSEGFPFAISNQQIDESVGELCNEADGKPLPRKFRKAMATGMKESMQDAPEFKRLKIDIGDMIDALIEGCRTSGYSSRPPLEAEATFEFSPTDYAHPVIASAVHDAGFDAILSRAKNPDKIFSETCTAIDDEERGSSAMKAARRSLVESLMESETADDWSWGEPRAQKFVDVLHEACYDSGLAKLRIPLTLAQENAIEKGYDYLDFSSFSRSGLIDQLAYEGFSRADSTIAVDHLRANWMKQAAKKAKEYMDMSSFSRSGLIGQLRYEGFTPEQAEHGARSVGY